MPTIQFLHQVPQEGFDEFAHDARRHGVFSLPPESLVEIDAFSRRRVGLDPFKKGYDFDFGSPVLLQERGNENLLSARNGAAVAAYCEEILISETQRVDSLLRQSVSASRSHVLLRSMVGIEGAEDLLSAVAKNMSNLRNQAEIFRDELPQFRRVNYRAAVGIFNQGIDSEGTERALAIIAQAIFRGAHVDGENAKSKVTQAVADLKGEFRKLFLLDADKSQLFRAFNHALQVRQGELETAGKRLLPENLAVIMSLVDE